MTAPKNGNGHGNGRARNGKGQYAGVKITKANREKFLVALRGGAALGAAAKTAGPSRRSFLQLRQADETFAIEYADAVEDGNEQVEQVVVEVALGLRECKYTPQLTACFALLGVRQPTRGWRGDARAPEIPAPPKKRDLKSLSPKELRDLHALLSKLEAPDGVPDER